jgi:hypothetical protein
MLVVKSLFYTMIHGRKSIKLGLKLHHIKMHHLPSNMFCVWHCELNTFYSFLTFVLRCHSVSRSLTVKYSQKVGQVLLRKAGTKYTGPNPHFLEGVKLLKDIWYSLSGAYAVVWDLTSCTLEGSYQRIGTTCWLHLQVEFFFSVPWKSPKYGWVFRAWGASKSIWNLRFWYSEKHSVGSVQWGICSPNAVSEGIQGHAVIGHEGPEGE